IGEPPRLIAPMLQVHAAPGEYVPADSFLREYVPPILARLPRRADGYRRPPVLTQPRRLRQPLAVFGNKRFMPIQFAGHIIDGEADRHLCASDAPPRHRRRSRTARP